MAITLTSVLKNMNENLSQTISNITPSATPIFTAIGKEKATNTYNEKLTDTLAAPNANNARAEGADAVVPSNAVVARQGNWTQIFAKEISVSGTVDAVDTAGVKDFARQSANAMKEIKTDVEASIVSNNPSVGGSTRKSAGLEAVIVTNAVENGGSTTPGFAAGLYGAPTDGTPVVVTEAMIGTLAQKMYNSGAEIKDLYVGAQMKAKLSSLLSGNSTRWNNARDKQAYAAVDYYTTDFGEFAIKPHRMVRNSVILAVDTEFLAWATLRPFKTKALGDTGDSVKVQLIHEGTLEVRNEAAHGKIAGIKVA